MELDRVIAESPGTQLWLGAQPESFCALDEPVVIGVDFYGFAVARFDLAEQAVKLLAKKKVVEQTTRPGT